MGLYAIVGEQIYTKFKFPLKCLHQLFQIKNRLVVLPRETSFPCARIFQDTFLPPHPPIHCQAISGSCIGRVQNLLLIMMSDSVISRNDCSASKFQSPIVVTQNFNMTTELNLIIF